MRTWSLSIVGTVLSVALIGACSSGGSGSGGNPNQLGSETPCQKLCRRAGEADPVCAPSDCVTKCDTPLPSCDSEYRAVVSCMANSELLACETNTAKPVPLSGCDAENSALTTCLTTGTGGTGGSGGTGGVGGASGSGGSGGSVGPCDATSASCVACGSETCDSPEACCWGDTPSCGASGSCTTKIESSCDGNEDCTGGQCCVSFLVTQDGSASSGSAVCSAGGGSVCCSGQGGPGCAGDKTVEACVCAKDDYCCSTDWDLQCADEVSKFGCATCAAGCDLGNASTGTGSSIHSVACRTSKDCAGVTGQFNVPYSECCKATNFGVGACVSQTYAGAITDSGGTCN